MKKQLLAVISVACTLTACSEALEDAPEVKDEGVFATLEQPTSVDTRSFTYENNKLVFTWGEGENLMAIGDGDAALFRTVNAGESSSKIESKGFKLMDGITYYAYLPAKSLPTSETEIPVSLLGQRQTENNSSAHLKDFDYACTTATKDEDSNTLQFKLANQIGWIIVEHTFTEDIDNVTSVSISVTDDIFVTEGTLDVATSTLTGETTTNQITLDLGKKDGDGLSFTAGELFRGFITIAPVDLSGKTLKITAITKDGDAIELGTSSKESVNITKSKFGVFKTSGSAVATVDGKGYSTLNAAMAAATEGTTIKLVGDVTTEKVSIDKSVTFDLEGNTVTADDDVFYIAEDDLTVNFKNGNIVSTKEGGLFFKQGRQNENITFDNCNITGVEGAIATSTLTGSTITINGGTFISSNNAVILTNGNSHMFPYDETNTALRENPNTIIINGGTFKGQMSDDAYNNRNAIACGIYAAWKDNIIVNDGTFDIERGVGVLCRGGKVTIKGGTFTTTNPGNKTGCVGDSRIVVPCQTVYVDKDSKYPDYENATIEISGGSFSDSTPTNFVADGYGVIKNGDWYKVVKATEVTDESSLSSSIGSYSKAPVMVNTTVELSTSFSIYGGNTLFVGANGVITPSSSFRTDVAQVISTANRKGVVNIEGDGIINGPSNCTDGNGSQAILVQGNQSSTLTVNLYGNLHVNGGSGSAGNHAITVTNGTLNIYGGYYYSGKDKDGSCEVIYLRDVAYYKPRKQICNIYGGVFDSEVENNPYLLNKVDNLTTAEFHVYGGTFVGFNPADNNADGAGTNYVADGYVSTKTTYNGKDAWVVTKAK